MSDTINPVYEILMNLKHIQHEMKNRMHNHFKDMELTAPQGMLVFMVNKHGSLKITEISEKLGLSNSTVSGIVDRLEAQGLVNRIRSEQDRRVVNVSVTETMKDKLMSHENILDKIMTEALSNATVEELSTVASGLSILSNLLQKANEGDVN